jgi:hypothetical protein
MDRWTGDGNAGRFAVEIQGGDGLSISRYGRLL